MSAIATAVVAGAVISGVASNRASSNAADASEAASQAQVDASREAREQQERLNQPYIELGTENIGAYLITRCFKPQLITRVGRWARVQQRRAS